MRRFVAAALIATSLIMAIDAPGQVSRVRSEFQVNTYTTDFQLYPSVAADSSGNFVVVWSSYEQDGYYGGIFGRRYSSNGAALDSEFQVNTTSAYHQYSPSVAAAATGEFVVAWDGDYADGEYVGIAGQRYDRDGIPFGPEFVVNTHIFGYQIGPSVSSNPQGDFVIAWSSAEQDGDDYGIFAQRFQKDGTLLGTEFQVNVITVGYQGNPSVAVSGDSSFVVAWTSFDSDNDYDTIAQRFDSNGVALGNEMRVNTVTLGEQIAPSAAAFARSYVVAWESDLQDGSGSGVFARLINADGLVGSEFQVNSFTPGIQGLPAVTADATGNFIIAWSSSMQDGDAAGIFAQKFDSGGARVGTEFLVNSYTSAIQTYPALAATGSGNFIVTWGSLPVPRSELPGQDGSFAGVFAQQFRSGGAVIDCVGDCNSNGSVTVDELVRGVNIALGSQTLDSCPSFDRNGNGSVTVDELVQGVNNALNGCPA